MTPLALGDAFASVDKVYIGGTEDRVMPPSVPTLRSRDHWRAHADDRQRPFSVLLGDGGGSWKHARPAGLIALSASPESVTVPWRLSSRTAVTVPS